MNEEQIFRMSGLFKAISHPVRLKILCLLQNRELSVGALLAEMACSGANVSQHLNVLRHQGVLGFRKEANVVYNRIVDPRVVEMMAALEKIFCSDND
ncbi:MAG: winged helix-turn-helix transcriptional regulator [Deltaproteobacteria bacterium]|nr:winged helix-turn-helix transcriptional regulator [Candidatus Anaeroferrophillus wilburensis]MBN2887821.1 winged helix-turn-helix transcriptional regulator [Deltaproteobacteria bacterium]